MYDSFWDKEKKESRTKSVMAFGYVENLISDGIPDPVAYYKDYVKQKNEERAASLAFSNRKAMLSTVSTILLTPLCTFFHRIRS